MKGQVLVSVVMLMIIAAAASIAISTRFMKNLRSGITTDFSARSLAAAESGIERMLLLPNTTLEEYINNNSCGSACNYTLNGDDNIVSNVAVTLEFDGNTNNAYTVELSEDSIKEINLIGYAGSNLNICWNSNDASIYASYVYQSGTDYSASTYAINSVDPADPFNGFELATSGNGYTNCYSLAFSGTSPQLLRLKSVYDTTSVYLLPSSSAVIPSQGILITSKATTQDITRSVTVLKSTTSLPELFDYALYQVSETDTLTND